MTKPRVASFFTGLGLFDLGFVAAGCDIAVQCEIDEYCRRFLSNGHAKQYWPSAALVGDIRDHDWRQWRGRIDICIGGFPCQPFSAAGHQKGAADSRNMWPAFRDAIEAIQPRVIVLENVPAICSPGHIERLRPHGRTGRVTRIRRHRRQTAPYALTVIYQLAALGYACQWGIISAADAGAPQRRERWWCAAYANEQRYPKPAARNTNPDPERHDTTPQPAGRTIGYEAVAGGQAVGDTHGILAQARQLWHAHAQGGHPESAVTRTNHRAGQMLDQPGLVGYPDGPATWMEQPQWPAPQGPEQYDHEPSRVLEDRSDDWEERVQALGNALVPQIGYALAREIVAYLKGD